MSNPGNQSGGGGSSESSPFTYPPADPAGDHPSPGAESVSESVSEPVPARPAYGAPDPGPGSIPAQQVPTHDQSPYASYSVDAPNSAPPTVGMPTAGMPQPSGPPMSGPPMSGPPYSGPPMSGPPMAGPQMSAPPYSGPPAYGAPLGGQPQPRAKRPAAVPILAGVLALFVIVAAVFVVLFVDRSAKLTSEKKTVATRDATIAENTTKIDQLTRDLRTKSDELAKSQQDLRGTQTDATKSKEERDVIGKCLGLLIEALDASGRGNTAVFNQKVAEMKAPCDQADAILG